MRVFAAWAKLHSRARIRRVSLADVAAEAGVGRTAMYNYFADKESLLLAYASWQMDTFLVELQADLAAADTASDKLRAFIRRHLVDFATRPLLPGPQLATLVGRQGVHHACPPHRAARGQPAPGHRRGHRERRVHRR